ncbi:uncharacterized protein [Mobula birostris]|uniref:uncharacterized protein n=1 Tax=Mobula birostris TaxID=1983395 RepID=UPI003B27C8AA
MAASVARRIRREQRSMKRRFNEFDHKLFNISQTEANSMDPQQKLLLECTYKVFENAGMPMENISGSKTGVFIGDCEMAVCGGVSCIIEPRINVALSKAKMISPDGMSKPFSNKANGYGRGEGCGILLLKPLAKAFEACENILGYEKENVQIHFLKVTNILKKWYLKKSADDVYKWMRSLRLQSKQLDFPRISFHSVTCDVGECGEDSYFTCKAVSVVDLNTNALNDKISEIPVYHSHKQLFHRDAAYIVTGGLSGLGFETVNFIAKHGGGYVIILSRSIPTTEKQEEFKELWKQFGTTVLSITCDISNLSNVELAISRFLHSFPKIPIKGVFHSAVVLHDALMQALNKSLFDKVLGPKIAGVLNLHSTTKSFPLDYFVCYSSVASFIGNSAQANYSAANSFLDIFAHYRRTQGLVGQSINWGALNLGLLLNKDGMRRFLESKGIMILEISEINQCLEQSLVLNNPQLAICKFNFSSLNANVVSQNPAIKARFYSLMKDEISKSQVNSMAELPNNSQKTPEEYVIELLSKVSNADPKKFTKETYLSSFGLDSMLSITVQNRIYQEKNIYLPLVSFLDPNTTVGTVTERRQENGLKKYQM